MLNKIIMFEKIMQFVDTAIEEDDAFAITFPQLKERIDEIAKEEFAENVKDYTDEQLNELIELGAKASQSIWKETSSYLGERVCRLLEQVLNKLKTPMAATDDPD